MGYYKDIREFIKALEKEDKLVRVKRDINKDTHLMPLVRWQFRGLTEEQRKAFLFENVCRRERGENSTAACSSALTAHRARYMRWA